MRPVDPSPCPALASCPYGCHEDIFGISSHMCQGRSGLVSHHIPPINTALEIQERTEENTKLSRSETTEDSCIRTKNI